MSVKPDISMNHHNNENIDLTAFHLTRMALSIVYGHKDLLALVAAKCCNESGAETIESVSGYVNSYLCI